MAKIKDVEIFQLFPTPVYISELNKFTKDQVKFVDNVLKTNSTTNKGNIISNDKDVLGNKVFEKVKDEVMLHLYNYMNKVVSPNSNVEIYITQSWLNYTRKNQNHHQHTHPNSYLSGVLYFDVGDEDKIFFEKNEKRNILSMDVKEYNIFNSGSWWLPVKTQNIFIFPSWLEHYVETKNENNLRISIAFNTFLRGEFGKEDMSNYLKL
jgi:uncharacterized protein (TIGR02466 family)